MSILERYEQQYGAPRQLAKKQLPRSRISNDQSMVGFIIRFSHGTIKDEYQANTVLLATLALCGITILFTLVSVGLSGTRIIRDGPGLSQDQLEMYSRLQPF